MKAGEILKTAEFNHDGLDAALRRGRARLELKVKTGLMFQPIRVAVCGPQSYAPPLFETLKHVLGRETCLRRIARAIELLPAGELS